MVHVPLGSANRAVAHPRLDRDDIDACRCAEGSEGVAQVVPAQRRDGPVGGPDGVPRALVAPRESRAVDVTPVVPSEDEIIGPGVALALAETGESLRDLLAHRQR